MLRKANRIASIVILACSVIFGVKECAWGQISMGGITGDVRDPSGNVVPKATVVLTNEATGFRTTLTTNDVGAYNSTALDPGIYDIEVRVTGFKIYVATHLELRTGEILRRDVALAIGSATQSVEVQGEAGAADLQRDSGDLSETLGFQTIQEIPATTRKVLELVRLTPGVTMQGLGGTANQTLAFFSIAGNPGGRGANYQMDGLSNNWPRAQGDGGDMSVTNPPTETMAEMRVVSNSYSAEFGEGIGGVILMTTKSGTNSLHGDAYEFGQNTSLDARNFFAAGRPPIHYNNFGGVVGGPIIKNKLFFFYSIEKELNYTTTTSIQTLPTALQRMGDFSQTFDANGNLIPIYDPSTTCGMYGNSACQLNASGQPIITRQQFPGNIIPRGDWDPLAANLLQNFVPSPNVPGTITGANNFIRNREDLEINRLWNMGRVDWQPTSSDKVYVRYTEDIPDYPEGGAYKGLSQLNEDVDPDDLWCEQKNRTFGSGWTRVLSPNILNDFRFGWVSFYMHFEGEGDNPQVWNQDWASKLGLKNLAPTTFPYFAPAGYYNFGASGGDFGGRQELLYKTFRTFQIADKITYQKGNHALRMGGEWIDTRAVFASRVWPDGDSNFNTLQTALPGVGGGNSIASMLLGREASGEIDDEPSPDVRTWYIGGYIQDDWRFRPNLTLNLGVRYEYDTPKVDVANTTNLFDEHLINPVSNTPGVITFTQNYWQQYHLHEPWYPNEPHVILPRFGFAWSPHGGNTVIRGGYGMFYAGGDYGDTMWDGPQAGWGNHGNWTQDSLGLNPAFILSQGFPNPVAAPVWGTNTNGWGAVPVGQTPIYAPEFWNQYKHVTYTQQWNLGVQQRLGKNLIEVSYMGTVGRHLPYEGENLNEINPTLLNAASFASVGGNGQALRPFPQFGNVTSFSEDDENSAFHALLLSVRRHFSQGLSFEINETYSSFMDDRSYVRTIYNREQDYGPSSLQLRSNFAASWVYESPWGSGKKWLSTGPGAAILGGWLVGGFLPIQSGPPESFGNIANTTGSYGSGTQGVNITGPVTYTKNFQVATTPWFNTSNISQPAAFTYGNAGPGIIAPPHSWEIDLNLTRKVNISERFALEFRMDAFNLTNHVNLGGGVAGYGGAPGVNSTFGSPGFGMITSAGPARLLQYGIKFLF